MLQNIIFITAIITFATSEVKSQNREEACETLQSEIHITKGKLSLFWYVSNIKFASMVPFSAKKKKKEDCLLLFHDVCRYE